MKTRIAYPLMAGLLLFLAAGSHAAGEEEFGGTLTLKLLAVTEDDQSAKFQEYRDIRDGIAADADVRYGKGAYHLEVSGTDLGLDDQSLTIQGGAYESFEYTIFFNEIPHHLTFGARTFYAGIGTGDLDFAAANRPKNTDARLTPTVSTDPTLWNQFDYGIERKQYGGGVQVSLRSPYYFKVGAMQEDRKGTKPLGADSGVFQDIAARQGSAFGNVVEMPEPVDYHTQAATFEAGYRTKPVVLKLTGVVSSFDNDTQTLNWRNPYVTTESVIETNYLAPENDYWKIGGQGVFRLPARSTLSLGASYARLTDDLNLGTTVTDSVAGDATSSPDYFTTTLGVNRRTFKGEVDYTTAKAAFDTSALQPVTLQVQYDYTGRKNHSSTVEYTNLDSGDSVESDQFEYHANHASLDLGWKLPRQTAVDLVYDFRDVDRTNRADVTSTTDHTLTARLRKTFSEAVSSRVQYQHLFRSSDFVEPDAGTSLTDESAMEFFERRFDVADKDRDRAQISVDLAPTETLDVSLEYAYTRDDYKDTTIGLLDETRHEAFADLSYQLPRGIVLGASVGYEHVSSDQAERQFSPGDIIDPAAGNTGAAFNWSEELKSSNWSYGLSAKVPLMKNRLELAGSWSYQKSDGEGLFDSSKSTLLDLDASDDYTKQSLEIKATCKMAKQVEVVLGYLYEKFDLDDSQWAGYTDYRSTSFLTGAYADEDYNVHVGYLMTRFTF